APGFIPETLDTHIYNLILQITTEEAYDTTRFLAQQEGIFAGISSGAAVAGMIKMAKDEAYRGKVLLAMLPDTGERYLSTDLWD
ncbi:MAG: pyridoxal-phosphate dependent enzyme, partial [Sedimenticola sp.]|nr:pyridoxal-phosphate dependent enzyme [Sedimenticola sp.]